MPSNEAKKLFTFAAGASVAFGYIDAQIEWLQSTKMKNWMNPIKSQELLSAHFISAHRLSIANARKRFVSILRSHSNSFLISSLFIAAISVPALFSRFRLFHSISRSANQFGNWHNCQIFALGKHFITREMEKPMGKSESVFLLLLTISIANACIIQSERSTAKKQRKWPCRTGKLII